MSIYSLVSDSNVKSHLSDCFKNRNLEQNLLYHGKWAELYYEYKDNKDLIMSDSDKELDLPKFWIHNCFLKWETTTLVSLGCGNSSVEKGIYERLPKEYSLDFIWVDLSKEMLKLSEKNLKNTYKNKTFVCADFASLDFKNEINNLSKHNQKSIYIFQ